MRTREGCSLLAMGCLFVVVGCLVFVALAGAMVLSGEVPLYAPHLTAFQPEPGYRFRPTTPITLTFDQRMDPGSAAAGFSLAPAVPGVFHWNEEHTQVVFVPAAPGYEFGTRYTARLASGIRAGTLPRTTARVTEWSFSLLPLLEASTPAPGQGDLGARVRLEARFHYALDCDRTLLTFSITPGVAGQVTCQDQAFGFEPSEPLEAGTAYLASLENTYLPGDPTPRPGVRWSFETAPPLGIAELYPSGDAPITDLHVPIQIVFNRPVQAESALLRFSLTDQDGTPVSGRVHWSEDRAMLVFQPDEPLRPGRLYRLVVREGIQDELGFALAETLEQPLQTAPMVGAPLPAPGSTDVALDSAIRIPFHRPMDRTSVAEGLAFTPAIEGGITWEEDTLVFTPRDGLAADTVYHVAVGAEVRDASGAPLAEALRWTFETEALLLDADVPGAVTLLKLQQPIQLTFALPMDRSSVGEALVISPTTPGELVWSDDGLTVRFDPAPGWLAGAQYEVSLSATARTAGGGQALGEDRTWRFSTGLARVQFGEGPNVQVLGLAGDRALQLAVQGADMADFRLYAITPGQLLDLYASGFRGIGPQEPQIIDTSGMSPTLSWREALDDGEDLPNGGRERKATAHVPAEVPPGLYVLAAEPPPDAQGQLILVLTAHALVLKRALAGDGDAASQAQILAWDTQISDSAPVVSATVRLYDRDGAWLAGGLTDAAGLLSLDVPGDPEPLVALAEVDGDITVCGLGNEWSEAGWWGWWSQPPSRPLYTTYSYTDRPVYRPGQTVYYKDILRADDDMSYTLPAPDLAVTVRLRDARENVAATQVLTPTRFGTVHGAFPIAQGAMLGTWNLETEVEGELSRQPFSVEEYRKPDYEVTVSTPQKVYVQGEAISVTVDAAYYFGQPVARAQVELRVYASYPDELYYGAEARFGGPILTREGPTSAWGRWTAVLPTGDLDLFGGEADSLLLALEATVSDETGQSVSSLQTVAVHRTSRGVSILLERHTYDPSEEIVFAARVRDLDGQPVAGARLEAAVLGWDDNEVAKALGETDQGGEAHFSVQLAEQGWYRLRVSGGDARPGAEESGRPIEAEDWLWVYDPDGQAPWYEGWLAGEGRLTITADRPAYAAGDVAQLLIYTPVAGPALLTFERGRTHHAEPVTLVSGTNLISVPVWADYAPNIEVTVDQFGPLGSEWRPEQTWPEAELHTASTQLLVPMDDRLLTVTVTADAQTYAPGEEATFEVRVTDRQGRPVVAEVSLAVVDEALYALVEDLSGDLFDTFYAPRPSVVRTFDSLRPSRWLYPTGGLDGMGGGAGGEPRRIFLDTAYWAPTVVTDETGQATLSVPLPDNLTEWRVLARAVTTDTLVGQGTTHVVVSQDIVVRPAMPRFLVAGDAITLTAVVDNFTGRPVSATVDIEAQGLLLAGDGAQQILAVPAGGSAAAGWPVLAAERRLAGGDGRAEAQVAVQTTATFRGTRLAGRDAVELSLPVYPRAIPEVATFAGALTPSRPTTTLTITVPADALEGLSRLEINLAPSIAPGLLDGLEYLIDYPFG